MTKYSKLTVLIVDLGNVWGGQEIYSKRLISQLREFGVKVFSLSPFASHAAGVGEYVVASNGYFSFFALKRQVKSICAEHKIDIVHFNGNRAMYLALMCRGLRLKFVATKHSPFSVGAIGMRVKDRLAFFLSAFIFRVFSQIICVASATKNDLPKSIQSRATVIPNGVPSALSIAEYYQEGGTLKICYVARLVEDKGIIPLLSAMRELRAKGLPVELHVAGGGPLAGKVEEIARESSAFVTFHGFIKNPYEVYKQCHLCALPSLHEGMPLNLLEAMSSGLALLATRIPGVDEVVNSDNGWLVEGNSANSLRASLENILEKPEEIVARQKNARKHYLETYTINNMTESTLGIYKKVLDES